MAHTTQLPVQTTSAPSEKGAKNEEVRNGKNATRSPQLGNFQGMDHSTAPVPGGNDALWLY